MKISLLARRTAFAVLALLSGLGLLLFGGSRIREAAAINMHNLFVTRHIYTQNMSCEEDSGNKNLETWIPADQFFTGVNSAPYAAGLYKRIEDQEDVNGYYNSEVGAYQAYADHQFRDFGQSTSVVDASRNVPNSFLALYGDRSGVSTVVDLPAGTYQLQVYGNHDTPGPVTLVIDLNDSVLGALTFDRDDESWEVKCLTVDPNYWWASQTNTAKIAIRFVGDGGPAGIRDGMVAWLRLIPISSF